MLGEEELYFFFNCFKPILGYVCINAFASVLTPDDNMAKSLQFCMFFRCWEEIRDPSAEKEIWVHWVCGSQIAHSWTKGKGLQSCL